MRLIVLVTLVAAAASAGLASAQTTHDLRGVWSVDVSLGSTFNNTQGWQIDTMDEQTGRFTGSDEGNTRWSITGTANGDGVTLTTDYFGGGYSATFTGTIGAGSNTMQGTWSDTNGQSGSWTARRTSTSAPPPPPVAGK